MRVDLAPAAALILTAARAPAAQTRSSRRAAAAAALMPDTLDVIELPTRRPAAAALPMIERPAAALQTPAPMAHSAAAARFPLHSSSIGEDGEIRPVAWEMPCLERSTVPADTSFPCHRSGFVALPVAPCLQDQAGGRCARPPEPDLNAGASPTADRNARVQRSPSAGSGIMRRKITPRRGPKARALPSAGSCVRRGCASLERIAVATARANSAPCGWSPLRVSEPPQKSGRARIARRRKSATHLDRAQAAPASEAHPKCDRHRIATADPNAPTIATEANAIRPTTELSRPRRCALSSHDQPATPDEPTGTMSSFTSPLHLTVHTVPLAQRPFELTEPFQYWTLIDAPADTVRWIDVPCGYRTDFASVPRIFWPLFPPVGRVGKAAVVHDWLCDESPHSCDHTTAADIFDEAMRVLEVPAWQRRIMVAAVKVFGPRFDMEPGVGIRISEKSAV